MPEPAPGQDVAEACADALLTACAQAVILQNLDPTGPSIEVCREYAFGVIDLVIERTKREGARPR